MSINDQILKSMQTNMKQKLFQSIYHILISKMK